ncbi:MAG: quinone-dependent dihydroorotate dehydrogenase [Gammaproteobacteria bacterium]|nr:quinone-dependent dihydroorotate dehydrogenase [Gammaproteobacteria bacterium]
MCYRLIRPLLFCLSPETAHHWTLTALKYWPFSHRIPDAPKTLWGLAFKNPIGVAAGLDKNGEYIDALAKLGFGFIEIGTTTPQPQPGNPKPRLFRLPQSRAIINRMGFNNQGIDALISNIKKAKYKGILGINIGKNASTPIENALDDYLICLKKAYPYASYITINISSPNTAGLRDLQHGEFLNHLLSGLKAEQGRLAEQYARYLPLLVKISPDLTETEIQDLAATLLRHQIDGVIATNTTISREGVNSQENGGLSGAPLTTRSTQILHLLHQALQGKIPLIGVGGIMNAADAQAKFAAGADLIQLYTGLIYGADLRTINE